MGKNQLTKRTRNILDRAYEKGYSGFGSIVNLSKATGFPLSIVKQYLHSKDSYTLYHNAKRKFKRLSVYARYINDIWCMDLAFVDKLSSENKGIKYLLVCVDIFSRYVRVEPMRNKYATTTKNAFMRMLRNVKHHVKQPPHYPNTLWVDQGTEFAGEFKKFCNTKGMKIYSTHSETKAAYAERAIRSLKRILYRFMEEKNTYTYINKLSDFVNTLNSRTNRSINMAPREVRNSDAITLHHLNSKPIKAKKPKYEVGDKVQISKYDIAFRKGYKPQFTREIFIINRITSFKPVVTYEIKDLEGEIIQGKFYEPELILTLAK